MNIHTLQVRLLFAVSRNLAYSTAVLISQADAMVSYTFWLLQIITHDSWLQHSQITFPENKVRHGTSGSDNGSEPVPKGRRERQGRAAA